MASAEVAYDQDNANVEHQDGGEWEGEGHQGVCIAKDGQEIEVFLVLGTRGMEGPDDGVGSEEAVHIQQQGDQSGHHNGNAGVAFGAQHWCVQRVAHHDVAFDHE